MLFSHIKRHFVTYNNIDEPWEHCVKWDKSCRDSQILYSVTYGWNPRKTKQTNKRTILRVERLLPGTGCMVIGRCLSKVYSRS